jgi:hypothetical protein
MPTCMPQSSSSFWALSLESGYYEPLQIENWIWEPYLKIYWQQNFRNVFLGFSGLTSWKWMKFLFICHVTAINTILPNVTAKKTIHPLSTPCVVINKNQKVSLEQSSFIDTFFNVQKSLHLWKNEKSYVKESSPKLIKHFSWLTAYSRSS